MALGIYFRNNTGSTWAYDFSDALSPTGGTYSFDVLYSGFTSTGGTRVCDFSHFSVDYGWTLTENGSTGGSSYTQKSYILTYTPNGGNQSRGCGLIFEMEQDGIEEKNSIDFSQSTFASSIVIRETPQGQATTGRTISYNNTSSWYIYPDYSNVNMNSLVVSKSNNWITASWYPVAENRGTVIIQCTANLLLTEIVGSVTIS